MSENRYGRRDFVRRAAILGLTGGIADRLAQLPSPATGTSAAPAAPTAAGGECLTGIGAAFRRGSRALVTDMFPGQDNLLPKCEPEGPVKKEMEAPPPYHKGISTLIKNIDQVDFKRDSQALFRKFAQLGVNATTVVLQLQMETFDANSVQSYYDTPLDDQLRDVIRAAQSEGISVGIRPIINEEKIQEHNGNKWRGNIAPTDRRAWWGSYKEQILRFAQIAQEEKAPVFYAGVELNSMEGDTASWADLLDGIRGVYQGKVAYSFNFDHFTQAPALSSIVDINAIDAFFRLNVPQDASVEALRAAWQGPVQQIETFRKKYPTQQFIFGEVGISRKPKFDAPFDWDPVAPENLEAQRRYYEVVVGDILANHTHGGYLWSEEIADAVKPNDKKTNSFRIIGSPSEAVVEKYFK